MFASNPYAELSAVISPGVMQGYVILMAFLVFAGTLYDVVHKGSARYFFANWRKAKETGQRPVGGGEMVSIAAKTAVVDVMTSGEFCNPRRRIAHLLTMYGFLAFVISTAIIAFQYPTAETSMPAIIGQMWHIGALMVCVGGYWFWFFIRADVSAEGNSPFRIVRADLFIGTLLESTTFGLIWSWLETTGSAWAWLFFGLHIIATTVLFASVPWSKFSHMFFKPAAAFEQRVARANGSNSNLPEPADQPATLGSTGQHSSNY